MMVALTLTDGSAVYVNPALVVAARPAPDQTNTALFLVGGEQLLVTGSAADVATDLDQGVQQ
jgi:uncharacterized protein YlzI (FlbEa/FlbD family)